MAASLKDKRKGKQRNDTNANELILRLKHQGLCLSEATVIDGDPRYL